MHQMNKSTSGILGGACRASNIKLTQFHPVIFDTSSCCTIILGGFKKIYRNLLELEDSSLTPFVNDQRFVVSKVTLD